MLSFPANYEASGLPMCGDLRVPYPFWKQWNRESAPFYAVRLGNLLHTLAIAVTRNRAGTASGRPNNGLPVASLVRGAGVPCPSDPTGKGDGAAGGGPG